jgi:NitT/TauT family transport system permease protein
MAKARNEQKFFGSFFQKRTSFLALERIAPVAFGVLGLLLWQGAVWALAVPPYVLPGPIAIVQAYLGDYATLNAALLSTLTVTGAALVAAATLGVVLALAMAASSLARAAIQPWAVILQVTPVVAIAPLIILWVNQPFLALVVCATIVAFFPVLSNTAAGLAATPPELLDLFRLNGATRWQTLFLLRLPAALPYFLAGLRISGTLALVGAVVAEFVAGSGGFASGLAYRIIEAGYRLEIPKMFAALVLLALAGIAIYAALGLVSHLMLRRRDR